MWDENAPLELLKEMPKVLTIENLCKIQEVIDKDKYLNSIQQGGDLCGSYAPFCETCIKAVKYPCAVAYVKMMQQKGLEVEIEKVAYASEPAVEPVAEPVAVEEEKKEETTIKTSGKKIRIAIARKKV
ncbi:MAG: hypothetical protein ACI4MB_03100 [Candidatus Coproplasma sp.]